MKTDFGEPEPLIHALRKVAEVLKTESEPDTILRDLAHIVREHIDADGAKVLVFQRGASAPGLEQLNRTDMKEVPRRVVEIRDDKGLAAWVVRHGDWILVPKVERQPERLVLEAITGEHGEVLLEPWLEKRFVNREDSERTLLMVPLRTNDKQAGVLGIWRDDPRPFDPEKDPEALLEIAPFVAAACRQVIQQRALRDELEAISDLSDELHQVASLADAYGAVAAGVARLSVAPFAVLLHHDPDQPGNLYHRFTWCPQGPSSELVSKALRGLHISCGKAPNAWKERVCEEVRRSLGKLAAPRLVVNHDRIRGLGGENELPKLVVVLLDGVSESGEAVFFADDLLSQTAASFLRYASAMLGHHIQTYPKQVRGEISNTLVGEPTEVLRRAAKTLQLATGASGVLVYSGAEETMKVTSCYPERRQLLGLDVSVESLTWDSIKTRQIRRVVDAGDGQDKHRETLDEERLSKIEKGFGWRNLRSWLSCPVVSRGKCLGVIKLLTAESDSFLGEDHEKVARAVAEWAAWEIEKLDRRLMLERLNQLANELTQEVGDRLGTRMLAELEAWVHRFVRPGALVAIISRMVPDLPLVNQASAALVQDVLPLLQRLSSHWEQEEMSWKSLEKLELGSLKKSQIQLNSAGLAVPIRLPKQTYLQGHLALLHPDSFADDEVSALREAAREIGLILNSERLRRQWTEGVGRFRHAMLGPVQGLTSRALAIALRAGLAGVKDPEINKLRDQIEEEAEVVRLWRHNQHLYLSDQVKVTRRPSSLRKVFDRCYERYLPIFAARGVKLEPAWKPSGEIRFDFDDKALDLALSNLLDNARKYGFSHRTVVLGAVSEGGEIRLWVEDYGHRIPERLEKEIYAQSQRLDWQDPFRTINGEGLGLPMARALVEAHDGKLTHVCTEAARDPDSDTAPFLVRFTIEIPTFWGR